MFFDDENPEESPEEIESEEEGENVLQPIA